MPISLPSLPFKLTPEDMGRTDLSAAIAKGLQSSFLPRQLPVELDLKKAQARSKNAYADLLLPQSLMKLLTNKEAFEALPVETQKKLQQIVPGLLNYQNNNPNGGGSFNQQQSPDVNPDTSDMSSTGAAAGTKEDQAAKAAYDALPSTQQEFKETGTIVYPPNLLQMYRDGLGPGQPPTQNVAAESPPQLASRSVGVTQKTPAENSSFYNQQVEQAKQSGKNDADIIKGLDTSYQGATEKQFTIDGLNESLQSPVFQSIRTVPFAGRHEIAYYAKNGTKAQQEAAGKFISETNQFIINSIKDFPQRLTDRDLTLLQNMKINEADTIDSAKGKLGAMSAMSKFIAQRDRIVAETMRSNPGIGLIKALDVADKKVKGSEIRKQVREEINPTIIDTGTSGKFKKVGNRWVHV